MSNNLKDLKNLVALGIMNKFENEQSVHDFVDSVFGLIADECVQVCLDEGAKFRGEQDITDFKICASSIETYFGLNDEQKN